MGHPQTPQTSTKNDSFSKPIDPSTSTSVVYALDSKASWRALALRPVRLGRRFSLSFERFGGGGGGPGVAAPSGCLEVNKRRVFSIQHLAPVVGIQ